MASPFIPIKTNEDYRITNTPRIQDSTPPTCKKSNGFLSPVVL